jgi:transcriptional regulator
MYLPPIFAEQERTAVLSIMREYPLANVVTHQSELAVSAVPTLADDDLTLRFHLAARNPQCEQLLPGAECLLIFTGPSCYVSPSWYTKHPSVPTWNYVTVHAQGAAETMTEPELEQLLRDLTNAHEPAVGSWHYEEMPEDFRRALLAEIRGFRVRVSKISAKSKLSQNRSADEQRRIAEHLLQSADAASNAVGRLMLELQSRAIV